MKNLFLCLALAAVAALGACASVSTTHDSIKLNGVGGNISASTGATVGQISATIDRVPQFIPAGSTQNVTHGCDPNLADAQSTFANLNSKANATATTVGAGATALASPSIAVATGDVTANGCAAIVAAAATTAHPADVIAAAFGRTTLPNAPATTIVRDGVAPPNPAPAAAAVSK